MDGPSSECVCVCIGEGARGRGQGREYRVSVGALAHEAEQQLTLAVDDDPIDAVNAPSDPGAEAMTVTPIASFVSCTPPQMMDADHCKRGSSPGCC